MAPSLRLAIILSCSVVAGLGECGHPRPALLRRDAAEAGDGREECRELPLGPELPSRLALPPWAPLPGRRKGNVLLPLTPLPALPAPPPKPAWRIWGVRNGE